jgi:uncharacterized membrane protein
MKFISEQYLIIAAFIWVFGRVLKMIPFVLNKFIPLILFVIGMMIGLLLHYYEVVTIVILNGGIAAGVAMFVYDAISDKTKIKIQKKEAAD